MEVPILEWILNKRIYFCGLDFSCSRLDQWWDLVTKVINLI